MLDIIGESIEVGDIVLDLATRIFFKLDKSRKLSNDSYNYLVVKKWFGRKILCADFIYNDATKDNITVNVRCGFDYNNDIINYDTDKEDEIEQRRRLT